MPAVGLELNLTRFGGASISESEEESPMTPRPAAYPAAYREQIIALARAGRSAKALAAEFEPSERTIRNWIFQAEADRGERPGQLTTEERSELTRLRRENRQLKVERDILGKAAVDSMGQRNSAANRSAGVSKPSVFRGRAFSFAAT